MNPVIENEGHDAGSRDSNPESGNLAVVFDVIALRRRAQLRDEFLRNSLCHDHSVSALCPQKMRRCGILCLRVSVNQHSMSLI